MNNITTRLLLAACLVLPLVACGDSDEAPVQVEQQPLAAPAGEDVAEWREYLGAVVPRHMDGIQNQPYVYRIPGESEEDFEGLYARTQERATLDLSRGIIRGNLLAFGGPNSSRTADVIVEAFRGVPEGTMPGVRILFIGASEDDARVREAVSPAAVDYVFIDAL